MAFARCWDVELQQALKQAQNEIERNVNDVMDIEAKRRPDDERYAK